MMKRVLGCLTILGLVSSAYAASLVPLTYADLANPAAQAYAVTAGPDGTVYVAGYTKSGSTDSKAAYWTYSGGTVGAPTVLPVESGGSYATYANGIGVVTSGTNAGAIVVSAKHGGGLADWNSGIGGSSGWTTRYAGSSQASMGSGYGNGLVMAADGKNYYVQGKNTSGTAYNFKVNSETGSATEDTWAMGNASNSVGANDANGNTVGMYKSGVRLAYIHAAGGAQSNLPYESSGYNYTQAFGMSEDGNTAVGFGRWTGSDTYDSPQYWTKSGSTWTYHRLGLKNQTGSTWAFDTNQDGTIVAGSQYMDAATPAGTQRACFWDTRVLDSDGRPAINVLSTWLTGQGVSLMTGGVGWQELSYVYGVHNVGATTYLVGQGLWTTDGGTTTAIRGFVLTIPEPATMGLLALGGLAMLRRRR